MCFYSRLRFRYIFLFIIFIMLFSFSRSPPHIKSNTDLENVFIEGKSRLIHKTKLKTIFIHKKKERRKSEGKDVRRKGNFLAIFLVECKSLPSICLFISRDDLEWAENENFLIFAIYQKSLRFVKKKFIAWKQKREKCHRDLGRPKNLDVYSVNPENST